MASKKDLTEAQSFSRRRLLTAFTSGAVGTTELEPAKPLRAVVAGMALTALVVLGSVFYGLVSPGLPTGWDNNRLVLAKDTGARYVSSKGTLYPVVNTASARLLIPSSDFRVVTTTSGKLASAPVGTSVGILGAPDQLPAVAHLVGTGWTACLADDGSPAVTVSATPAATADDGAAVVRTGAGTFVVTGRTRYRVAGDRPDAVLRALGLGDAVVHTVDDRWINLFEAGDDLGALVVTDAGTPVRGTSLTVGQAVHATGSPDNERYLVRADGTLAALSPLAYQLYLLGTGAGHAGPTDVGAAELAGLANAHAPAGGASWPTHVLTATDAARSVCALARRDGQESVTTLATAAKKPAAGRTVTVDTGAGALVLAVGEGTQTLGTLYLVDATGTAFPVVGDSETLARLGYTTHDVATIGSGWISLLAVGPALSTSSAGGTSAIDPSARPTASATP